MNSLTESEVRKIIRKNILEQMLFESSLTVDDLQKSGRNNFGRIGVGTTIIAKSSSNQVAFFVPDTYPKSGKIYTRPDDNSSFKPANQSETELINNFLEDSGKKDMEKFDPDKNLITPDMRTLLNADAATLFEMALKIEITPILEKEFKSTWKAINDVRKNQKLKSVGFIISGKDRNIIMTNMPGKPAFTSTINKIDDAQDIRLTKFNMQVDEDELKNLFVGGGSAFALFKSTSTSPITSYLTLDRLSKAHKEAKGKTLFDLFNAQSTDPLGNNGVLKSLTSNNMLDQIPIFYVKAANKKLVPIYVSGDERGYESTRKQLIDAASGGVKKKEEPKPPGDDLVKVDGGKETLKQDPKTKTKEKTRDYGPRTTGGGARLRIMTSDNNITSFDQLGYQSGTDDKLRTQLRMLVKNERKFRGTGILNLEVIYNTRGQVARVKFRKGQGKLAARQIEMLKSRIKEVLNSSRFEKYSSSEDWLENSNARQILLPQGRKRFKVDMALKLF